LKFELCALQLFRHIPNVLTSQFSNWGHLRVEVLFFSTKQDPPGAAKW
jgi:hypothetical protein